MMIIVQMKTSIAIQELIPVEQLATQVLITTNLVTTKVSVCATPATIIMVQGTQQAVHPPVHIVNTAMMQIVASVMIAQNRLIVQTIKHVMVTNAQTSVLDLQQQPV